MFKPTKSKKHEIPCYDSDLSFAIGPGSCAGGCPVLVFDTWFTEGVMRLDVVFTGTADESFLCFFGDEEGKLL